MKNWVKYLESLPKQNKTAKKQANTENNYSWFCVLTSFWPWFDHVVKVDLQVCFFRNRVREHLLREHVLEKIIRAFVKQDRTGKEARQRVVFRGTLTFYAPWSSTGLWIAPWSLSSLRHGVITSYVISVSHWLWLAESPRHLLIELSPLVKGKFSRKCVDGDLLAAIFRCGMMLTAEIIKVYFLWAYDSFCKCIAYRRQGKVKTQRWKLVYVLSYWGSGTFFFFWNVLGYKRFQSLKSRFLIYP